jgi:hypothetical protein
MVLFGEAPVKYAFLALAVLIVPACGSSNDNSTPPPPPQLPVAIVPEPMKVLVNKAGVALDGSKSHDTVVGAPAVTFLWQQIAGDPVVLSGATTATATFTAPANPTFPPDVNHPPLVFQLTVTGAQGTDSATVTVNVNTCVVTAADALFVGYGNTVAITPTLTGTPPHPAVFTWSGIPPWLPTTLTGASNEILHPTAPLITDLQNFEDIPSVAVLERTGQGRVQLTLTVTDSVTLAVLDKILVNYSAGPFPNTVANENVALGNPVFLNGAATVNAAPITSWTWVGYKPDGTQMTSTAAANSDWKTPNKAGLNGATSQRFAYFVPSLLGTYQIQIAQTPGPVVQVITINCGKYVGVGNQIGTVPDPFKGECAACHAGQLPFVANFADPWKVTQHAHVFEEMLDPANPVYGPSQAKGSWKSAFDFVPPGGLSAQQLRSFEFSVDQRTVGFSLPTGGTSAGWAERAAADGFALPGASWSETIRKTPNTAALSNTQCESCHGPGSEHAGDTTGIRKSFDSMVCGRCHAQKEDVWEASSHADRTSAAFTSASGNSSCNGCHTAQGFVVEMNAQQTADPHPVLYAVGNVNRPVIAFNDRRTQTCQTCHDPHQNTIGLGGANPDPQLRCFGNVQFRNGATTNAGRAAVCYMCHQSRTDTTDNSADMNGRRAPHDSTAAEMLAGTNAIQFAAWANGYAVSPHAIPSRFFSPGGEVRQCLACHNDVQPAAGTPGFGALGGHSFNVTQGTDQVIPGANNASYASSGTVAGTKLFKVTGGPSFLKSVFAGDTLLITGGADASITPFTVASVDSASQLTLSAPSTFVGNATAWSITSVKKYNTGACVQCHTTAADLRDIARGDYDGNGTIQPVQDEIDGLLATLSTEINSKLATLLTQSAVVGNYSFVIGSGRISYTLTVPPAPPAQPVNYVFPGPSVSSSQNPQIAWANLTAQQQKDWLALYQATYNWAFVTNDNSHGIHNTGYAVNLLQSSIKQVNPAATVGTPFVPFP